MSILSEKSAGRGFSIVEAILGVAIFGLLAAGALIAVSGPLIISADAWQRSRAAFLAEEGIEATRAIRSDGWSNLADGVHGLAKVSGAGCAADECWSFSGAYDDTTDDTIIFRRVVTVDPVERDGVSGDIVESGGTVDPDTKKVTVVVTWTSPFGISRKLTSRTYLTGWNSYRWKQTTESDFAAGGHDQTEAEGSGEEASVILATSASAKSWMPNEGHLTTHSSQDVWESGDFTDTHVSGIGADAVVTGDAGELQWIEIYAGKSFFQTTDAHFNNLGSPVTGSFNDTVAVDTGDLGAVALNTRLSWAALTSGVADHLNDVNCVTATDCFAVGAGGRIIRWNGSSWSTLVSPTANELRDIDMVSANDGWAVGAGGVFIRWDGANWTLKQTLGTTANGVHMVSANAGWAVGNSGKIWRWTGGPNWNEFSDTGNQVWSSVWMVSANDGWAVSEGSDVRRWNGAAWNVVADPTNRFYYGVSCAAANLCFAVGSNGVIIKWNGAAWVQDTASQSLTANPLRDVYMISSTAGWAIGDAGTVLKWNGAAWSLEASPPSAIHMTGVFQVTSDEAYAVGNNGTVWQYATHYYTSGTYTSRVFDAGAVAHWGHSFWDEYLPDATTDLTVVFRGGDTATPDGSWSGWLPTPQPLTDSFFSDITVPDSRYLQYRATLTSTGQLATPRLNYMAIYYNEPSDNAFYDLKVTSATDGWAVGGGGNLARFNGTDWTQYLPSPTANSLLDIDFTDASHVWAVGDNGTIVFWDGSGWTTQTSNTTNTLFGVDVVSASFAVAVGAKGTILNWNGAAWSVVSAPTNKKLAAVSCVSASDCWAVGDNGAVIQWNGMAWSSVSSPATRTLNGVFAWDADTAYAVGGGGAVYHWDGVVWTARDSTTPNELRDVFCARENDCWAWGIEQTFLHWDGSAWSRYVFTNPSNPLVQGGQMLSLSDGWAVGEGGAIYHYTTVFTSPSFWRSPVVDSGAAGTRWNTISWDSLEPLGTGMQIVTRTCDAPDPGSCVWSDWSAALSDKGGSLVTSPTGQYLQYEVVLTTTVLYNSPTLSEVRIIDSAATGQALYDIDGIAEDDIWAAGRAGTLVHYDGTSWTTAISPTSNNLNGIDQLAADDAFAVGAGGAFIRWDGSSWNSLSSPTGQDMGAVSMLSAAAGYAVGTDGTIAAWDGSSWTTVGSPTGQRLRGIDLFDDTIGFAVGNNGTILQWDGISWTTVSSPTASQLNAVHLFSATLGVAVGVGGTILQWDGISWAAATSPVVANLNAVEFRSETEAWAGGDFGTILSWDGAAWESFTSPTTRNRYGITVEAPTDGWMCGDYGSLIKDPAPYATVGEFLSSVLDTDGAAALWDAVIFNVTLPAGTAVNVSLRSGDTPTPDGSWSAFGADLTPGEAQSVNAPSARYLQYRAGLTTTDVNATPRFDDITVTYHK